MTPEEIKSVAEVMSLLKGVASPPVNQWLPLYAALGGAITGAIASFFPTYFLESRRETREARRIKSALLTEIAALLEIIEYRGYLDSVQQVINHLETQSPEATYAFTVMIPGHYSRIYQENCSNIGVIESKTAKDIVMFHQLLDAVVQDVKPSGVVSEGANIESFKELKKIFAQAINIAQDLTST